MLLGQAMSNGDLVILVVAGYLALVSFVRLLQQHRQTVLNELQRQVEAEKRQQLLEKQSADAAQQSKKAA